MPAEVVGHAALPARPALGLEPVDQIDDVEEPAAGAVADAGAGDGDGEMGLAGAGAADQDDVALLGEEAAAGEVAHQRLVDRRAVEVRSRRCPWPAAAWRWSSGT